MRPNTNLRSSLRPADSVRLLAKRRKWYAEGDDDREGQDGKQGEGGGTGNGKYNPADLDEARRIIQSLEKRLGERDAEKGTLQKQIDDLNARISAGDKAQKKKLEEEGNYKTLLDQANAEIVALRAYQERATALEEVIRQGNQVLIERLPEDKRGIVPTEYPPEKLRTWLDVYVPVLMKAAAPDFDAGAGAGSGKEGSALPQLSEFEKQLAAAANMDEKTYAATKKKQADGLPVERQPSGS